MKTVIMLCAIILLTPSLLATTCCDNSNWNKPFSPDKYTRGLWHFDQNSGDTAVLDVSGNNNNGTLSTGKKYQLDPKNSWVAGKKGFGNCIKSFVTASDTNVGPVEIPQTSDDNKSLSISPTTDMTIEFWMNPSDSGSVSRGYILMKYSGVDYYIYFADNKMIYGWYSGGWHEVSDTTTIPLNQWTHVAIQNNRTSQEKTDTIAFYINGKQSTMHETPDKGKSFGNESMWVMNHMSDKYAYRHYNGMLDELRISDVLRYAAATEAKAPGNAK